MALFVAALVTGVALSGCGRTEDAGPVAAVPAGDFVVATSFYPTAYFVERLAGDLVELRQPLPEGEDPAFWRPDADAMAVFQNADLVVLNGASFEKWADTAPLPRTKTVLSTRGLRSELIEIEGVVHSHGPAGEHSHAGTDGHTWTDPIFAQRQADTIRAALVERLPQHAAQINASAESLSADLLSLDARFRELGSLLEGRTIAMSHASYNYPARRYGWTVIDLDLPPETRADQVDEITVQLLGEAEQPVILWESEPNDQLRERLTGELGAVHVLFTPAESISSVRESGATDYLDAMRKNLDRLEAALRAG